MVSEVKNEWLQNKNKIVKAIEEGILWDIAHSGTFIPYPIKSLTYEVFEKPDPNIPEIPQLEEFVVLRYTDGRVHPCWVSFAHNVVRTLAQSMHEFTDKKPQDQEVKSGFDNCYYEKLLKDPEWKKII